jgi:ribonuclease HII
VGISPDLEWELKSGHPQIVVIGVDEVGRGCLAGPVVAGAVALPAEVDLDRNPWLAEIKDSKGLSPEARERLAPLIQDWALSFGIGQASVEEIDKINIYHAAHLAMVRAIGAARERLSSLAVARQAQHLLIDGKFLPKQLPCPATAIIKGDQKSLSIAAASIIAKVWRDRHMVELDREYPGYGFAVHKGYSTPAHSAALKKQGVCNVHRRTFAPVAALL